MTRNDQDMLARAHATLKSLRNNITEMTDVTETFVCEFHATLDRLEGIGYDVSGWRIPDAKVQPRFVSSAYVDGEKLHEKYSDEKYVDKYFILTKLDAILGYFEIVTAEKPRRIGFTKSND